MATNHRFIPVPPGTVWGVLADPASYGHWVVGSKRIRDADPGFPAVGTRFHHSIGVGPLTLDDHTQVLEAHPPRRLVLRAKARPLGTAKVELELTPERDGTRVRMVENPDGLTAPLGVLPPLQMFTRWRNSHSLQRLEKLALARAAGR